MNHLMALVSLHCLSELSDLTLVAEKLEARLILVHREILSDDANDEANQIIADIGRRFSTTFYQSRST
jgi:hypothetical protein